MNVFLHTPGEKKSRQLTHFTPENVYLFAWSKDGAGLAVARGSGSSDVVLLSRKREAAAR